MVDPNDGEPPQSRPPRLTDLVSLCRGQPASASAIALNPIASTPSPLG